jgi:hypothetical protein
MSLRSGLKSRLLCSVVLAGCAVPQLVAAQTQDLTKVPSDKGKSVQVPPSNAPDEELDLGPFAISATGAVGEGFSDNIFVTKNNRQGDWITTFAPSLSARLGGPRNRLTLTGGGYFGRYARFTSENFDDYYAAADGRLTPDAKTSLFGGAHYDWTHESRESPDNVYGLTPTRYRAGDYYAGVVRRAGKATVRLGGTLNTYSYDNVLSSSGIINNKDRNRLEYETGVRVGYRASSRIEPFVQGYWVSRDYDHAIDDYGYRRSSTGYRAAAGVQLKPLKALSAEAYAGVIQQSYDDARFGTQVAPDFGARLTWRLLPGGTLQAFVDRTIEETTLPGSSGYLRSSAGASVEQKVRPDLYFTGHFYYSVNDYRGVDRIDHVNDIGLGAKYFLMRNVYIGTDYTYLHRTSDTASADFRENRLSVRLGVQTRPAYRDDPARFEQASSSTAPAGFYVAALAGNGTLTSAVAGPRGSGGSLVADFGNNGWQGDIAAGYGVLMGRFYVGAEADAALGSQHWLHTGTGGTRVYGVREEDSYALAARLGYLTPTQSLVYGRFGGVATKFSTPYTQGLHSVRPDGYQRGLRFGGGAEFPLAGHFAGRLEYTETTYADYDVQPSHTADNFANHENLTRFGIVYRFGKQPEVKPAPKFDYDGLTLGLQAGFGTLISKNNGARNTPKTLSVQRADSGTTGGMFVDYGITFRHFYLGVEGSAELSNSDWNIERDPTGRIYSVAKDYSVGAAVIAGYIFKGNTLVYGRAGGVSTRFSNTYTDENGLNHVEPDDTVRGLRLGGGVAIPINKHVAMRFDYTWTRYASYDVNYVTGVDRFRNSENLFRVGLAFKI